ncbi:uncharacterized protein LOC143829393 [Paroedura picta]|uniref:uncharacterized protein LOC143829393 n=1 Tax=Paroedura picta TaxID=143630 RepID=UPI00405706A4
MTGELTTIVWRKAVIPGEPQAQPEEMCARYTVFLEQMGFSPPPQGRISPINILLQSLLIHPFPAGATSETVTKQPFLTHTGSKAVAAAVARRNLLAMAPIEGTLWGRVLLPREVA